MGTERVPEIPKKVQTWTDRVSRLEQNSEKLQGQGVDLLFDTLSKLPAPEKLRDKDWDEFTEDEISFVRLDSEKASNYGLEDYLDIDIDIGIFKVTPKEAHIILRNAVFTGFQMPKSLIHIDYIPASSHRDSSYSRVRYIAYGLDEEVDYSLSQNLEDSSELDALVGLNRIANFYLQEITAHETPTA